MSPHVALLAYSLVSLLLGRVSCDGTFALDESGHLRITTSDPSKRVFVNGIDIQEQSSMLASLETSMDTLTRGTPFGKLYAVGGLNVSRSVRNVEMFDGVSWTRAPDMSLARSDGGVATLNGFLYAIGGAQGALTSVERFDGFSWTMAPSLNIERSSLIAVTFRNLIYAIGGFISPRFSADVEAFDGDQWRVAPSLLTPRSSVAGAVYQDRLYVLGGGTQNDVKLQSVERFDGTAWSGDVPPMSFGRYAAAATSYGGFLYVAGGYRSDFSATPLVEAFDGLRWTSSPQMINRRYAFSLAVFKGAMYAVEGYRNENTMKVSERFNGTAWTSIPSLLLPRWYVGLAVY